MYKTTLILVFFFHVVVIISASELNNDDDLSSLVGTNCTSYRPQSQSYHFFDLDSLMDARPTGHKEYFHLSVIANKSAHIALSSAKIGTMSKYEIVLLDIGTQSHGNIRLYRNGSPVITTRVPYAVAEVMDVVISITDDNILTVTVDGRTPIVYDETNPFPIKAIGFAIQQGEEARFFYNCKWKQTIDVSASRETAIRRFTAQQETDRRILADWDIDSIQFTRQFTRLATVMSSPPLAANVVIAITDNNVLTLTIDGKTLYSYTETDPFPINYFVFLSNTVDEEARLYYNCKSDDGASQCGKRKVFRQPLITSGLRTREGDWPWHAAIYHTQLNQRSYQCGGTLITSNAVLTAAHCLYESGNVIVPERVIVTLGKYDLKLFGPNTQDIQAYKLFNHNGYDQNTFQNDIAIIRLTTEATFTSYVQPICLWQANRSDLREVIGRDGIVVGWGFNERFQLPDKLDLANMPVVEPIDCLESDPDFFGSLIHRGSFCAGFRNGTGACNGDSGGGMYFEENGAYALRGIVSQTRARSIDVNFCNPNHYVVFTDVAYYLSWILEKIK